MMVLPASLITNELPVGTGMSLAMLVDVEPELTSTKMLMLLLVRLAYVPPIRTDLTPDGEV